MSFHRYFDVCSLIEEAVVSHQSHYPINESNSEQKEYKKKIGLKCSLVYLNLFRPYNINNMAPRSSFLKFLEVFKTKFDLV